MELGAEDEHFLNELFGNFASLWHLKWRDTMERYREKCKLQQQSSPYIHFLNLLISLITAERSYMQLCFGSSSAEPRSAGGTLVARLSSVRRDTPSKIAFANLSDEFRRLTSTGPAGLIAELAHRLADFCMLRSQLIFVYSKLVSLSTNKATLANSPTTTSMDVAMLEGCVRQLQTAVSTLLLLPPPQSTTTMMLHAMHRVCLYECTVLQKLIQSHIGLLRLHFMLPLHLLHETSACIIHWRNELIDSANSNAYKSPTSPLRRASFFSKLTTSAAAAPLGANSSTNIATSTSSVVSYPRLFEWLNEYYQLNLAKYGIYFFDVFSIYAQHQQPLLPTTTAIIEGEMIRPQNLFVSKNNNVEFQNRIAALCRKHDARCMAILANMVALTNFAANDADDLLPQPNGYELPSSSRHNSNNEHDGNSAAVGLDAFRVLYHLNFGDSERKEQLPGIVMLMMEQEHKLVEAGNVVQLYDKYKHMTIFISRLESHMYFVMVCGDTSHRARTQHHHHHEYDANTAQHVREFVRHFNCSELFSQCKA